MSAVAAVPTTLLRGGARASGGEAYYFILDGSTVHRALARRKKKIFPVPAAALFEEEVLIKAALNCNQELISKLLGVIRASHAYTALVYSATCNNTLSPCFHFSNPGSVHFCYKSKRSELLEEEDGGRLFAGCSMRPRTSKSFLRVGFAKQSRKNTRKCCVDDTCKPCSPAFAKPCMLLIINKHIYYCYYYCYHYYYSFAQVGFVLNTTDNWNNVFHC